MERLPFGDISHDSGLYMFMNQLHFDDYNIGFDNKNWKDILNIPTNKYNINWLGPELSIFQRRSDKRQINS